MVNIPHVTQFTTLQLHRYCSSMQTDSGQLFLPSSPIKLRFNRLVNTDLLTSRSVKILTSTFPMSKYFPKLPSHLLSYLTNILHNSVMYVTLNPIPWSIFSLHVLKCNLVTSGQKWASNSDERKHPSSSIIF